MINQTETISQTGYQYTQTNHFKKCQFILVIFAQIKIRQTNVANVALSIPVISISRLDHQSSNNQQ